MDEYLIGVVQGYQNDKIIFEVNNHGYLLNGVNLTKLSINETLKLYIYFFNKAEKCEYFAFLDQETKNYFLELISINYVGPKTALKILNFLSLEEFKQVIKFQNIKMLQQCKGVTKKLAIIIIEHFTQKTKMFFDNKDYQQKWKLIFDALIKLGFSKNNINNYLLTINWNENIEQIISNAVRELNGDYY